MVTHRGQNILKSHIGFWDKLKVICSREKRIEQS